MLLSIVRGTALDVDDLMQITQYGITKVREKMKKHRDGLITDEKLLEFNLEKFKHQIGEERLTIKGIMRKSGKRSPTVKYRLMQYKKNKMSAANVVTKDDRAHLWMKTSEQKAAGEASRPPLKKAAYAKDRSPGWYEREYL